MSKTFYDELFEVDKILDKKIENNKVYYLVSWKGYGLDENSWEPSENLK